MTMKRALLISLVFAILVVAAAQLLPLKPHQQSSDTKPAASPQAAPTAVETTDEAIPTLLDILIPHYDPQRGAAYSDRDMNFDLAGYTENEHRNVLQIREKLGRYTPVMPGYLLSSLNQCMALIDADVRVTPQKFCLENTTVVMNVSHFPRKGTESRNINSQGVRYFTFFPHQPLPEKAIQLVGEQTDMCPNLPRTHNPHKLICYADPKDGTSDLYQGLWGERHNVGEPLPPNPTSQPLFARERPFASASDRVVERAYIDLYEDGSNLEIGPPSHTAMPGRFLPAVRACSAYLAWVSRDQAGNLDLNEYLVVVREAMPSEYEDDTVFTYAPNIPLIQVELTPQPMPLAHFPTEHQEQMKADLIDRKVPLVAGELCLVDPRSDKVYGAFPAVEAGTWAGED